MSAAGSKYVSFGSYFQNIWFLCLSDNMTRSGTFVAIGERDGGGGRQPPGLKNFSGKRKVAQKC